MASETFTFYVQPWYRKSPYFEATKRHGCKSWGLYNHMLLPTLYDDPVTEYRALLNDVTLWDVAVERCVEVRGPDAFDLVNLVTCRDLTKVEPMQARYVLLTAPWGGIVNDPVLLRLDRESLLARARRLGRAAVPRGRRGRSRHGRLDLRGRRRADADPGSPFEGRDARPVRRRGGRPPLLLLRGGRGRRHPGRDQQDRVDGGGRVRALPAGHEPRRPAVRARVPGGRAVRDPRDRAERGSQDRGGHLQLRLGHPDRGHAAARERARAVRRVGPGRRLPRPSPPGGDPRRRPARPQAGRASRSAASR